MKGASSADAVGDGEREVACTAQILRDIKALGQDCHETLQRTAVASQVSRLSLANGATPVSPP